MMFPNSGLYAITDTINKSCQQVLGEVAAAIKGGAVVVQYRDKNPIDAVYLARELVAVCHAHNVPLIINDDVELAATVGADGVHLGKHDGDILVARERLGRHAIIGVSCYNDLQLAVNAEKNGVDYVAFGRFFPSNSKPLAAPAQISTLSAAKKIISVPIVAIGGILPENGAILLTAGADVLAVIGGVFTETVETSARAYQTLFKSDCR